MHWLLLILLPLCSNISNAQAVKQEIKQAPVPSWVSAYTYAKIPSPDEKDINGGQYLELYEAQYNIEKEAVYNKVIRKITSEAGVQSASQMPITFSPSYQHLTFHHIRVMREGQAIDQLDLSGIKLIPNESDMKRFIYSGLYTAYVNLNDVRPGDRVEYDYTITGTNPILDHQFSDILYFNSQTPISHLYIRLIAASGQPLYFRQFNNAPNPHQSTWSNKKVYEWKLSNRPSYIPETNEPVWFYGAPYVQVTSSRSWSEIANWAVTNVKKAEIENSPLIRELVEKWNKKAGDSDLYFVKLATRFVQDQIRYQGVEMGPYSHLPHHPDQVLKQRYGDCKDKSLLLCTFLRLRNINASLAFVNVDYGKRLNRYLPSYALFDHAIVTFHYKDNTYWIDPTISYQRGNMYNIATPDYGYALVIRPHEDSLTRMVVNSSGYTEALERFNLPKHINDSGILTVVTKYTGAAADNVRNLFKINSQRYIQKTYLDYYNQLYKHVSILDSMKLKDDPENDIFTVNEKYALGNTWNLIDSVQKIKRFAVYGKSLENRLPVITSDDRKAPLSLISPVNFTYRIQLITPEELNIQPSDRILTRKNYYYSFGASKSGDTINLDYIFQTYRDYIAPDSVGMVNKDIQLIDEDLAYYLTSNETIIESKGKISWISILIALLCISFFTWFAVIMYRYSPKKFDNELTEGRPIRGWLILVCIGLCVTPLRLVYSMILSGFFTQSLWLSIMAYHHAGLIWLVIMELIGNLFSLVFYVFLLFLFFQRRNTFPVAFIFICIFNVLFLLGDHFISRAIIDTTPAAFSRNSIGMILYSCIWIPYFLISKRVKETFIYPYQKKENLSLSVNTEEGYVESPDS